MIEPVKSFRPERQTKNPLIVALDVETAQKAREIVAELKSQVGAFKIGLQLFTSAGASFVREIASSGAKVFLDAKFHDIPNTVAKASIEAARLGVWMFNVHAAGGGEMMRRTVENVRETCERENLVVPQIIAVTVLTSSNQETLSETGIEKRIDEQVLNLAFLAAENDLDGVVASPLETEAIRKNVKKKDFLIVTPGIRNARIEARNSNFETSDDQKRVTTAKEAIRNGADYIVVGRPILEAKDKLSAVKSLLDEIAGE